MHALTTYELRDYRRQLEHAVKGISPDAPVQADLRRKLDEVLNEQIQREQIKHGCGSAWPILYRAESNLMVAGPWCVTILTRDRSFLCPQTMQLSRRSA
jgi:hypothetical protein